MPTTVPSDARAARSARCSARSSAAPTASRAPPRRSAARPDRSATSTAAPSATAAPQAVVQPDRVPLEVGPGPLDAPCRGRRRAARVAAQQPAQPGPPLGLRARARRSDDLHDGERDLLRTERRFEGVDEPAVRARSRRAAGLGAASERVDRAAAARQRAPAAGLAPSSPARRTDPWLMASSSSAAPARARPRPPSPRGPGRPPGGRVRRRRRLEHRQQPPELVDQPDQDPRGRAQVGRAVRGGVERVAQLPRTRSSAGRDPVALRRGQLPGGDAVVGAEPSREPARQRGGPRSGLAGRRRPQKATATAATAAASPQPASRSGIDSDRGRPSPPAARRRAAARSRPRRARS